MKKYILIILPLLAINSCSKIEETINEQIEKTTTIAKEKAQNAISEKLNETVSSSINSLTNAENAQFKEVFPKGDASLISDFTGKKFTFPNGSPAYVFKYKADKELLIPYLEQQETANEEKSDQVARKIDGKSFMDKLQFVKQFLPVNTIDMSFLEDLRNNQSVEYYKIKRFPNSSTIIYNPKTNQVFQFVEISK